jgi:hypothetical protein
MKFFSLSTEGEIENEDLCLLEGPPKGMEREAYRLMRGVAAASVYPQKAKIYLEEDNPGIKLTSLLGNTDSLIIANTALKDVIAGHCKDLEIEYLPFVLYDHRKRVHSKDYFIVNPVGARECLNELESGIKRGPQNSIVKIERFVIDANKAASLPALFRIDKDPTEYVVREDLAAAMEAGGFTNVFLTELEVK